MSRVVRLADVMKPKSARRSSSAPPRRGAPAGSTPAAEADAELDKIETLVAAVRAEPGRFPDPVALTQAWGGSEASLAAALRRHYHIPSEALLTRARLARAKSHLLESELSASRIAKDVGYATTAAFDDDFQRFDGLPPSAYRALRRGQHFALRLPAGYPLGYLMRALGRDPQSVTERLVGNRYSAGLRVGADAYAVELTIGATRVAVSVDRPSAQLPRIHAIVVGLLGLDQETTAFAALAHALDVARLVQGRTELRIAQTSTVFDGLIWAIVGQQINLTFASLLKRRLMEKSGTPVANGLLAPPTPERVATLIPEDLLPLRYSRQKADYLISVARLISAGTLDLDALRTMSATRAERTLLAIRGLGPWSVNYLMMRSLGFADCLPLGDTGVTSGLLALFALEERPNAKKTLELMAPFSPFRSLATAHLWQFGKPLPE